MRFFRKDAVRNGKPVRLSCVEIHGQNYCLTDSLVKVVRLEEEWHEDMNDPASVVSGLIGAGYFHILAARAGYGAKVSILSGAGIARRTADQEF